METEGDDVVHAVQLNPAILNNVRRRVYDSLEGVLIDALYVFFSKMFLKAVDDSGGHDELNPLNVFIDRLDIIPKWGEEIVEATTNALKDHAEKKYKFFDLKKYLKKILSTQLCQAAALENKACTSKIQLNDVHVSEFLYNLLKLSAPHVSNAPQLFTPRRGTEYVKREEGLDLFLGRSVRRAVSQFIELFLWRISAGEVDNPFVAMPKAAVEGPPEESVAFKEVDDNVPRMDAVKHDAENPFDMNGQEEGGALGDEEEDDDEEEGEGGGSMHAEKQMEFDDEPDKDKSSEKPWSLEEGPRGRFNEDDDLENDERRNPRQLSFNEKVEVKQFESEKPVSILKRNNPSRIYKTKFDPDA